MPDSAPSDESPSRTTIIRDAVVFLIKLWLEGFKDVALMPLSLGAAAIDFLFGSSTLYGVMRLGDWFERWVHLYAAIEEPEPEDTGDDSRSLDHLLNEAADGMEESTIQSRSGTTDASRSKS